MTRIMILSRAIRKVLRPEQQDEDRELVVQPLTRRALCIPRPSRMNLRIPLMETRNRSPVVRSLLAELAVELRVDLVDLVAGPVDLVEGLVESANLLVGLADLAVGRPFVRLAPELLGLPLPREHRRLACHQVL